MTSAGHDTARHGQGQGQDQGIAGRRRQSDAGPGPADGLIQAEAYHSRVPDGTLQDRVGQCSRVAVSENSHFFVIVFSTLLVV